MNESFSCDINYHARAVKSIFPCVSHIEHDVPCTIQTPVMVILYRKQGLFVQ